MFDVITIGSVTFDNFLEINAEKMFWDKVPSKRALVFPFGEKVEVLNMIQTVGGNSANASITFARQGFKTACSAKIGKDLYGAFILKTLKKEKVNTKFIVLDSKLKTAYSTILLSEGERTILGYHGASNYFNLKDLKLNAMKSKWWYVSLAGESYKIFNPLLDFAYKNNIAFAFNPSGYHLKNGREDILKNLPKISVLLLNEEEASFLAGISWKNEKEVFKKLDKLMPGILVVTRGNKGVVVSDGNYIYRAGIFYEKKLVDRTGAGDAFGSGFIAGLLHYKVNLKDLNKINPKYILEAIKLASANATSVVEHIGAQTGILTFSDYKKQGRFKKLDIKLEKI